MVGRLDEKRVRLSNRLSAANPATAATTSDSCHPPPRVALEYPPVFQRSDGVFDGYTLC